MQVKFSSQKHEIISHGTEFLFDEYGDFSLNFEAYLVGNIDRHPENWGLLVDNQTNIKKCCRQLWGQIDNVFMIGDR